MDKKLTFKEQLFYEELNQLANEVPEKEFKLLFSFFQEYKNSVPSFEEVIPTLLLFIRFVKKSIHSPFLFEPYHQKIRKPFDYYHFGMDFIRPLIDLAHSTISGTKNLNAIDNALQRKENVILLANHQTESDPQAISVMLEKTHPHIGQSIIYVAGERVTTDPLAIPFSMGCDLLCIYSRRYIDYPPELKGPKQLHNKKTMSLMKDLLEEGGKIIYVAPSGGRDRKNKEGVIELASFDPDSIEMFYLMARKSKTPTHFIPLSLSTYDLLPPPDTVQKELGEMRFARRTPIHLAFAGPFDMLSFQGSDEQNKHLKRKARAEAIWSVVHKNYQLLVNKEKIH